MYDHGRTMLLFWSCATTPGDSTASSVGTCESVGISVISRDEMTVPDVAEVVSIRAASAVTSTDCVIAPTSSTTSSCLMSAACRVRPSRIMVLNPGRETEKR